MAKPSLDKDLKKVDSIQSAAQSAARTLAGPGLMVLFAIGTIGVVFLAIEENSHRALVIIAAIFAAYMALNIGANDVANNVGPAVGSRVLTMTGAILIAAICEASGAILAGGDVVKTIARDLIHSDAPIDPMTYIHVMMAALLAASLWIHLATFLGAPVSTTHSIVGGVMGSGAAAAGVSAVNWSIMAKIAASWVVSPVLGGVIAAILLGHIKWAVLYREDRAQAAVRWVPVLVGLMAAVFSMYLLSKGLKRVWHPDALTIVLFGALFFAVGYLVSRPWVKRHAPSTDNSRKAIAGLFTIPLIFAVSLLSFAHGANDVANAVGPLAAIVSVADTGTIASEKVTLPLWVLVIGAFGISIGLMTFGPRLIRTVGEKITKMNPIRAFCVALSAAITVLIATASGLPVSSTHIAIGAVFGVGYLREFITNKGVPNPAIAPRSLFLEPSKLNDTPEDAIKNFQKRERRKLVRRQHVTGIISAWLITVPASALVAAASFALLRFVLA